MNPSRLFPHSMSVFSATYTSVDSAGAKRGTETPKATAQDCRVEDVRADQQLVNLSLGVKITHRIFTLYSGAVNGDIVTCTRKSDGGTLGTFRLISFSSRRAIGNMDEFQTIEAQEIK